jgi:hypothetical protein
MTKKNPFFGNNEPMEDYSRNIWGWKFSMFSLVLLLSMSSIMAYRHFVKGEKVLVIEKEEAIIGVDTLRFRSDQE